MGGESKASANRIVAAGRQARALELRKAGIGYAAIARELGYAGPSGDDKATAPALRALVVGLWADARRGNVAKIDRVLMIMARRADLLGLDAPRAFKDVADPRRDAEAIAAEIGKPELVDQIERAIVLGLAMRR